MEILDLAKTEQLKTLNLSCNAESKLRYYIHTFWSDLVTVHSLCYIMCSISPFDFAFVMLQWLTELNTMKLKKRMQADRTPAFQENILIDLTLTTQPTRKSLSCIEYYQHVCLWGTQGACLFVPLKAIWVSFLSMLLKK